MRLTCKFDENLTGFLGWVVKWAEFRLIERVKPFLDRTMRERYQPAEAVRRGQATLSDFFGLVTSMPRDLAR